MAGKRMTTAADAWHKIAFCFCLMLTVLFPIALIVLWHVGFHGIVIGVGVLLVCLPACGFWLSSPANR
jgi:hypothetical protein